MPSLDGEETAEEEMETEGCHEERDPEILGVSEAVLQAVEDMAFATTDRYGVEIFSREEKQQIKLMALLRQAKAPLKMF